jgi:hypothetical protein
MNKNTEQLLKLRLDKLNLKFRVFIHIKQIIQIRSFIRVLITNHIIQNSPETENRRFKVSKTILQNFWAYTVEVSHILQKIQMVFNS